MSRHDATCDLRPDGSPLGGRMPKGCWSATGCPFRTASHLLLPKEPRPIYCAIASGGGTYISSSHRTTTTADLDEKGQFLSVGRDRNLGPLHRLLQTGPLQRSPRTGEESRRNVSLGGSKEYSQNECSLAAAIK